MPPPTGRPPVARSSAKQEESIFNIDPYSMPIKPKIRTYNIAPPPDQQAPTPTGGGPSSRGAPTPTGRGAPGMDSSQISNAFNPVIGPHMSNAFNPIIGPRDAAVLAGPKPMLNAFNSVIGPRDAAVRAGRNPMSNAFNPVISPRDAAVHAGQQPMSNAFNPVIGPRDAAVRAGQKPANHARSNAHAVKEQSQMNALRKMNTPESVALGRPGLVPLAARSPSAPQARPASRGESEDGDSGGRNFLKANRLSAGAAPPRVLPSARDDQQKYLTKKDYGRVPSYLLDRKVAMQERMEEEQRSKEAANVPPGMRLMAEEERVETLSILKRNKEEIEKSLWALPLRIETPGQIRRKAELDLRLQEIEDAFKIFSRMQRLRLKMQWFSLGQFWRKAELDLRVQEIEDAFKIFSRPKVVVHI
eukprot:gene5389-5611_t